MSVRFYTDRGFPPELRNLAGYGDTYAPNAGNTSYTEERNRNAGETIVAGLEAVSPWNFLTGVFVDKPKAEAAAAIAAAQMQSQAISEQALARQETLRMATIAGAGLIGALVLIVALKPAKSKTVVKVAGYRKRKHRRARR